MNVGVDLEFNSGFISQKQVLRTVVTADDLFASSYPSNGLSIVAQDNPGAANFRRLVFKVFSPVDLMVSDASGRKSGFDPVTGTLFDEIPNVLYNGSASEPESLSLMVEAGAALTVTLSGTGEGSYTFEALELQAAEIVSDTFTANTVIGQVDQFNIRSGEAGALIMPVEKSKDEETIIFLPFVLK